MAKSLLQESELTELPPEIKNKFHRLLYRQECRTWLLAAALLLMVTFLTAEFYGEAEKKFVFWFANVFVVFLAFWVTYPSQQLLTILRKNSTKENIIANERKFDDSWNSVWDFVPPLVVPILALLILFLVKIWYAI